MQSSSRFTDAPPRAAVATVANEPTGVLAFNTWSKCGGSDANAVDTSVGGKLFPATSGRTSSGGSTINPASIVSVLTDPDLSNVFTSNAVVVSTGTNGRLAGVNPTLVSGAVERGSGTDPRAGAAVNVGGLSLQAGVAADRGNFFAKATHRGAFRDYNWMVGWSLADQLGVFAGNTVNVPEVTVSRVAGVATASFATLSGVQYNVEVSSDNKTYTSVAVVTGNNSTVSQSTGLTGIAFVRVTPL